MCALKKRCRCLGKLLPSVVDLHLLSRCRRGNNQLIHISYSEALVFLRCNTPATEQLYSLLVGLSYSDFCKITRDKFWEPRSPEPTSLGLISSVYLAQQAQPRPSKLSLMARTPVLTQLCIALKLDPVSCPPHDPASMAAASSY